MKKIVSVCIAAVASVGLLCGFAREPEENTAFERRQFESAAPIASVQVEELGAKVTVRTADTDHVTVEYTDRADQSLYSIAVEDSTLSVRKLDETGGVADRSVTITLPRKHYAQVQVSAAAGDVQIQGVEADTISTDVSAGKVSVQEVHAGTLEIDSAVGAVRVQDTTADRLTARSVVGEIRLEQVRAGQVGAASTLGTLTLEQVEADTYDCSNVMGTIQGTLVGDQSQYNIDTQTMVLFGNGVAQQTVPGSEKSITLRSVLGTITTNFAA